MDSDIISFLIYVALALVGVIASAYKNKAKRTQNTRTPQVPRTFKAEPDNDYGPELGPLMELFDVPRQKQEVVVENEYESIERGPGVEEVGMLVDTAVSESELEGFKADPSKSSVEKDISEVESFEEGQSDIQKMIAKYDAIRKNLEQNGIADDIASGEIVSVEAEEEAQRQLRSSREYFDAKKAIIYSEILKRKEY